VLLGTALAFLLVFVAVATLRAGSMLPLEYLEPGIVQHVRRILTGQAVYGPPTELFVPFVYPPVYYWAAALFANVSGPGYGPLRLLSLISTGISLVLVGRLVHVETRSMRAGILAACLLAAAYRAGGAWFDIARVDMLMLALLLAGLYLTRTASSRRRATAAGVAFALAVLTKQPALVACAPVVVWQLAVDRRLGAWLAGGCLAALGLLVALLEWQSGGWFLYYTAYVAARRPLLSPEALFRFANDGLMRVMPIALLVPAALLSRTLRSQTRLEPRALGFHAAAGLGVLAAGFGSEAAHDSMVNALLPAYAWLTVILGISIHELTQVARRHDDRSGELTLVACYFAQFLMLAYLPWQLLPGERNLARMSVPVLLVTGNPDSAANLLAGTIWLGDTPAVYADPFATDDLLTGGSDDVNGAFLERFRAAVCRATRARPVLVYGGALKGDAPFIDAAGCNRPGR
jgi:4-amino-4-deoxy-L-arabinose transferase-like glycosyltransferase